MLKLLNRLKLLILMVVTIGILPVQAKSSYSLALFNLTPENIQAMGFDADMLYAIRNELSKDQNINLIPRRDIESVLYRLGGIKFDDPDQAIRYGRELGVTFVITGSIKKQGSQIDTVLYLYNTVAGKNIGTFMNSYSGRADIISKVPQLTDKILDKVHNADFEFVKKTREEKSQYVTLQNFTASNQSGAIQLNWQLNNDSDVFYYNIYRGSAETGPFEFLSSNPTAEYLDDGLDKTGRYFYSIGIVTSSGDELKAKQIANVQFNARMVNSLISPPTIINHNLTLSGININFAPKSNNSISVANFNLYIKSAEKNWLKIKTIPASNKLDYSISEYTAKEPGSRYQYAITAASQDGSESEFSQTFTLTTPNTPILSSSKELKLRENALSWPPVEGNIGTKIYRRVPEQTPWKVVAELPQASIGQYIDNQELADGISYQYKITYFDPFGESLESNIVTSQTKALFPAPKQIKATSGQVKQVFLSWQPLTDPDISGYVLFRNEGDTKDGDEIFQVATIAGKDTSEFTDGLTTQLLDGTQYNYAIATQNRFGANGQLSPIVSAETKPKPVSEAISISKTAQTVELRWPQSQQADVIAFHIYRKWNNEGWEQILTFENDSSAAEHLYIDKNLKPYAATKYKIVAQDKDGLLSEPALSEGIVNPAKLQLTMVKDQLLRTFELSWNNVNNMKGYKLYRRASGNNNWEEIKEFNKLNTTSYRDFDKKLKDGQQYEYQLTAYDEYLETPASNIVTGVTKTPPSAPLEASAESGHIQKVVVSWQQAEDQDTAGYIIYRKNKANEFEKLETISSIGETTYVDDGNLFNSLENGTTYSYKIASFNKYKVVGKQSTAFSATTKPVPSKVTGLSIANNGTAIALSWQSNSEIDISSYHVYRSSGSCSSWSKFKTTQGNSIEDSDLTPAKKYCYKVQAIDSDKLEGNFSDVVSHQN